MKKVSIFAFAFLATLSSFAQAWKLDKAHSKLGFTVTHMAISEVDGNFKNFDVVLTSSKDDFSDATFDLTADLKTLSTNNEMRDGHLQKPDMFDTEKNPTLTFKSTSIKALGGNKFALSGNLTIKGVTKPETLNLVLLGKSKNRDGKDIAGFKATGTIKRSDFGVGNMPSMMVGDDVELRAGGEFIRQ